jgi:hypothetical protein
MSIDKKIDGPRLVENVRTYCTSEIGARRHRKSSSVSLRVFCERHDSRTDRSRSKRCASIVMQPEAGHMDGLVRGRYGSCVL